MTENITINKNITIANTREARESFERFREHIEAAAMRYPVVIGPQGVVFYDPREFDGNARI
jgi:hypothetical protein